MFRTGIAALALFMLSAMAASAQTGKLSGTVLDDGGQPVIGATALILDTTLGAAADLDGRYSVLRIPPGTYRVRFSSVGYQTKIVEDVLITSNNTTTLDVTLGEEVFEGEEVVITAERPIVDVSLTSSISTLTREEIDILPVQGLDEIVNLQAGVVDGHFRGGRVGEVQYQVDGVSVNNPYDNSSTLRLDRSVLQEVQVISGTFDAEYGQAMSGVVNAVLRTGDRERYAFSAEMYMGDYLSPNNDSTIVRSALLGEQKVVVFPHIDEISPTTLQNYQASLSGPVPLVPSTTFLVNGQRIVDMGHLMGERRFLPTDRNDFEQFIFSPSGDGAIVPMNFSKQWSWLGKVTNHSLPNVQLGYQVVGSLSESRGYNHAYRFNPDGQKTARRFSIVHGLDVTHTLSDRTFYELNLRQNYIDYEDLKYEDLGTPPVGAGTRYALPEDSPYSIPGQPRGDANYEEGAIVQGVDLGRFVQSTNALVVKAAVTSQATRTHLLKGGIELQVADLRFGNPRRIDQVVIDGIQQLGVVQDTLGAVVYKYDPVNAAAFLQDRVEWGDIRVRAGVRLEYFDANSTVPSNLKNPANSIDGAPESRPKATTVKLVVAPRLGISFPILETASVFFSYGHFYQMPGLGQMFSNADYSILEDLQAGAVTYGVLGNPDLRPEFTSQYEFGFKSEITSFLGLDVSLFYKDIRDLLGVEFVQTYTAAEYARLTNIDFGGVRGFTISLDQRRVGPISTSLDFTLQTAIGNASDPRETANRAAAGEDPRPRQVPFNWDQRNTLNGTVVWLEPGNFSVTTVVRFATGQPYTPSISTGFGADLESNSGRKPSFATVDLRAEKFVSLGGVEWTVFGRVFNLFDQHFTNGFVYSDTGSPYYTVVPTQQRNPNPGRLSEPRRIEIGLSLRGAITK
jgi:outer membrane receptor protein involved in Fe transport